MSFSHSFLLKKNFHYKFLPSYLKKCFSVIIHQTLWLLHLFNEKIQAPWKTQSYRVCAHVGMCVCVYIRERDRNEEDSEFFLCPRWRPKLLSVAMEWNLRLCSFGSGLLIKAAEIEAISHRSFSLSLFFLPHFPPSPNPESQTNQRTSLLSASKRKYILCAPAQSKGL